jgi:hypothetical protein
VSRQVCEEHSKTSVSEPAAERKHHQAICSKPMEDNKRTRVVRGIEDANGGGRTGRAAIDGQFPLRIRRRGNP